MHIVVYRMHMHKKMPGSLFLGDFLALETEYKLRGGQTLLALEDMAEMGGVGKAALLGCIENGDFGKLCQQSFGLGKTGTQDVFRRGLTGGLLDTAVELAGAHGKLGGQRLDVDRPAGHVLLERLGKLFEQLFVAVVFYTHGR